MHVKYQFQETIWVEIDKIMRALHPTHTRSMKFLSMKPTKGQTPSNFIQRMNEEALDAQINELTEQSLILHLTTAGLPHSDLNKDVKTIIIKELRVNPNQKDLKVVLEKIKGVEADHLPGRDSVCTLNEDEYFGKYLRQKR